MEAALGKVETDFTYIEKQFQSLVSKLDLDNCICKDSAEKRVSDLQYLIDKNRKLSACVSCPQLGKCPQLKWNRNLDMVRITGCSRHPDQKKFLGHSTTVNVYTDTAYNYGPSYEGISTWAVCYAGASGNTYRDSLQTYFSGNYAICRMCMRANTEFIPDPANITGAVWNFYLVSKTDVHATYVICCYDSNRVYPSYPIVLTDFNRTIYNTFDTTNQKNIADITAGAFNTLTLNTALINKVGYTTWTMRTGRDYGNSAPTGVTTMHWKYYTDNFGYLSITYDDLSPNMWPVQMPRKYIVGGTVPLDIIHGKTIYTR